MKAKLTRTELQKKLKKTEFVTNESLISFLMMYSHQEFMYASVLRRNLKIYDSEKLQQIINTLVENKIVIPKFRYVCTCCNREFGNFRDYKIDEDEDEDIYCDICDNLVDKSNKSISYQFV